MGGCEAFDVPEVDTSRYDNQLAYELLMLSTTAYYDRPQDCMDHMKQNVPGNTKGFHIEVIVIHSCEFIGFLNGRCAGILATSHEKELIAISYRGTTEFQQLVDEVVTVLGLPKKRLGRGNVQQYFNNAHLKLKHCLFGRVKELVAKYPNYKVAVSGHSLGGAIASIAAYELVSERYVSSDQIMLYTYGMPRVGDKKYALDHDRTVPESWRLVHYKDCVPHFPTCAGSCTTSGDDSPFQHRSEVFFDARYMTKDTNYRICHDNEDGSCSHTYQGFLLTPWNANECGESHKLYYNITVGTYCENNLGPSTRKRSLTDINGRNFTLANDHCAVLVKIDDDWVVSHKKSVPTVVDQTTPNADSGCQLFEGAFNWYLMTSVFVFRLIGIY